MIEIGLQLPFLILFVVMGVTLVFGLISFWISHVKDSDGWGETSVVFGGLFILAFLVSIFTLIPYNPAYWKLYSTSGTVESVSNGFAEGNGDMTWRSFMVKLEGDETPYVLTDPRASQLEGKDVRFTCEKEFVYQAADRINCYIAEVR